MINLIVIIKLIFVEKERKHFEETKCSLLSEEDAFFVWNPILFDERKDMLVSKLPLLRLK